MKVSRYVAVPLVLMVAACNEAGGDAKPAGGVLAADPWLRSNVGSQMPDMTAGYVNLTNPTDKDISLVGVDCSVGEAEIHEMVELNGEMVMRQTEAIVVPAGSHEHLAPNGPHIMVTNLDAPLEVGGEEIACTLKFDDGNQTELSMPIKEFTAETEVYHTHAPSDRGQDHGGERSLPVEGPEES